MPDIKLVLGLILFLYTGNYYLTAQTIEVKTIFHSNSKCEIQLKYTHDDTSLVANSAGCGVFPFTRLDQRLIVQAIGQRCRSSQFRFWRRQSAFIRNIY